MPKVN